MTEGHEDQSERQIGPTEEVWDAILVQGLKKVQFWHFLKEIGALGGSHVGAMCYVFVDFLNILIIRNTPIYWEVIDIGW